MNTTQLDSTTNSRSTTPTTHKLLVREVRRETADAVTLVFETPEAGLPYSSGQFLTLKIPCGDSGHVSRCYSFSSSPNVDPYPAVTVKRTASGLASNWLCDNAGPGTVLEALPAGGTFVPRSWSNDLLLFAAGSGITPILSIAKTALAEHDNAVNLVYANRDRQSTIFADQLAGLQSEYSNRLTVHHWLESESGLPTSEGLHALPWPHADVDAYLCGPTPFMQLSEEVLDRRGVPRDRVHREVFRSLTGDPFDFMPTATEPAASPGESATATVELDGETTIVSWPREKLLLDTLLDNGLDAPYVCREGSCGGCGFRLLDGEVRMLVNETLDDYELGRGVRLACQSLPVSDSVSVEFE
ncbi:3-ketosteroid 9alpha-monooxygenase subunit B [Rhodococcus sp. 27YEA15]|uniref:2Fe-2S iron-sulfur cluster-binding protein n=1 Tax=Rhodococcus sp. 27YEA15 TaxID=3156259 RepID=UPI003C7A02F6